MSQRVKIDKVHRVIAIASGKGGVGKSTVSVNLALALVKLGYRVGLFDGDLHGPDVPLMLGARRKGRATTEEASIALAVSPDYQSSTPKGQPLERYGLKVMSLGLLVGEDQPVVADTVLLGRMALQLLRSVDWGELDFLLIDLPPGTGEPQATFSHVLHLDGVVLVTTPPDVSLLDTTKALNLFREQGIAVLGLVENMSYYVCPKCGERHEIFPRSSRETERAVRGADVPVLGQVGIYPALGLAADSGRPLLVTDPEGEVATVFVAAARQFVQRLEHIEVPASSPVVIAGTNRPVSPPVPAPAGFSSDYLAEVAVKLLVQVREGLDGKHLERDQAGMQAVVTAYKAAWADNKLRLPAEIQKELIAWLMAQVLPE